MGKERSNITNLPLIGWSNPAINWNLNIKKVDFTIKVYSKGGLIPDGSEVRSSDEMANSSCFRQIIIGKRVFDEIGAMSSNLPLQLEQ